MSNLPREEYPRPQLQRQEWKNLNGTWSFAFDDLREGLKEKWYLGHSYPLKIVVPYVYQSKLSGILEHAVHDVVWYETKVRMENKKDGNQKRVLLHFGASDYRTRVWVNGNYIGIHEGGHSSFTFEISHAIEEENRITVMVEDESRNLELPRGKQFWKEASEGIFYTGSTGIWQTVWIEELPENFLKNVRITPDTDQKMVRMEFYTAEKANARIRVKIEYEGLVMAEDEIGIQKGKSVRCFFLDQNINLEWEHKSYEWTPENPKLFDVSLELLNNDGSKDRISMYFAMRKVSVQNGKFLLNNRPYYQKLLLDQGYWRDSLLTAPNDEAFVQDINMCKEMGFNGVRKHQKAEDPRFLYWADKMGLLVWEEYANAYVYSTDYVKRMIPEWMEIMERDYNHPCIIAWVPLNESWGTDGIMCNKEEQSHSMSLYHITKSLDQTRMVISNDGWNHTKSDLLTVHDYTQNRSVLEQRYQTKENLLMDMPANRTLFALGYSYEDQPVILSEFGGISFQAGGDSGWGYASAENQEEFIRQYQELMEEIKKAPIVQGYVYTQFYDLEQEINGLLTYDREYKIPPKLIKSINTID